MGIGMLQKPCRDVHKKVQIITWILQQILQLSIHAMEVMNDEKDDCVEELGLVLETMGAFVVVSQSSAQSEQYGVIPKDRFIQINEVSCEHKGPDEIVRLIQTYVLAF